MRTLADVHRDANREQMLRLAWAVYERDADALGRDVDTRNPHARLVINLEKQRGQE